MSFWENVLAKTAGPRMYVKEHESTIEIVGGLICFGISVVMAAKAGIKTKEIMAEYNQQAIETETHLAEGMIRVTKDDDRQQEIIPYTQDDHKKDMRNLKLRTAGKIAVTWAPSALGFAGGTGLVLRSHHVMVKSNLALMAALKTADEQLDKYRAKVSEKIGEEKEKQIFDGVEVKKEGRKEYVIQGTPLSKYARFISRDTLSRNADWCRSSGDYNLCRIKQIEEWANRQLHVNGKVTRKEVYDGIGIDVSNEDPDCEIDGWKLTKFGGKTEEGGIVIRIYDHIGGNPNNCSYVKDDFDDKYVKEAEGFWIDLNCEGCILANSTIRKIRGE